MRRMAPLGLGPWPPGRACRCGSADCNLGHWEWRWIRDGRVDIVENIKSIAAAQPTEAQGKYLLREVATILVRASRDKCLVVETIDGIRVGDVDRLDHGRSIILELRCHTVLDGEPGSLLRIYFTEPQQGPDLLGVSVGRKVRSDRGRLQQDEQWRAAEVRVRRWWLEEGHEI